MLIYNVKFNNFYHYHLKFQRKIASLLNDVNNYNIILKQLLYLKNSNINLKC